MSQTIEFEINKQFKNYIVIVKTMSKDKEKSFYDTYGKDALVFGYVMKLKIKYRYFRTAKTFKKMHYSDEDNEVGSKMQRVFTSYSGIPSYKLQEIVSVLNYYHINYIIVDKIQNYKITHVRQFKDNNYDAYYQKGLYYKRILTKIKSINKFLRVNSDSGEIIYLIYDIERCMNDYLKRAKILNNDKVKKLGNEKWNQKKKNINF